MPDQIIYETQCQNCLDHQTELGTLKKLEEIVKANFEHWSSDKRHDLVIAWFEQYKTDERMKYIERSKNKTTEKIQGYKKQNIATMQKEG